MRKLSWPEYCKETQNNTENLRHVVKKLRKTKGESVPDNFVKMAETDLTRNGTHIIGEISLKKLTEDVLVEIEYDEDEFLEESKTFDGTEKTEITAGVYKVISICKLETFEVYSDTELYHIMSFAEASEKWGLGEATLRNLPRRDSGLIEGIDYRKSGKVWLITDAAMRKLYGEPKIIIEKE